MIRSQKVFQETTCKKTHTSVWPLCLIGNLSQHCAGLHHQFILQILLQPLKEWNHSWTNPPFPSPQSPRRWFSLFPPADPVCRIRPERSGKSWTCAGWRAAASRSVPEQDPRRCGHKHKPAPSATKQFKSKQTQMQDNRYSFFNQSAVA